MRSPWRVPLLALLVAAVAGVRCDVAPAHASSRLQANKVVARRDARALLGQLQLPRAVSALTAEPAGDGTALRPPPIRSENTLGLSAWWTSRLGPATVLAYVRAHRPSDRGSYQLITEPSSSASTVIFSWTMDGPHLFAQQLRLTVAALTDGRTGIMAQAQSVWMIPRPLAERVPDGVRSVDVSLRIGSGLSGMRHQRTRSFALAGRRRVARVVRRLDGLPMAQPGQLYMCALILPHVPRLTLRFLSAAGATLARAQVNVYPGGHGASGWNSCDPIELWIRGRSQTPLTSHTFVRWLGAQIGANVS